MPTQDKTNYIIGAVVLIIIILIGWLLIAHHRSSSAVIGSTNTATSTDSTANAGDSALTVADQAAGSNVQVNSMQLSVNGWIAIKDTSDNRILGAGWFPAGATSGSVPLLRATVAGGKYEAVVYSDDGDKAFDMHKDTLVDGQSAAFSAQ